MSCSRGQDPFLDEAMESCCQSRYICHMSVRALTIINLPRLAWTIASALAFTLVPLSGSAIAAPSFEDSIAQRTLACTACHGEQGRAGPDGYYPRLAGKPAGYLYNQLLNFRDGRRHYGLMTRMVDLLDDRYLMEIAQYFADMQVPYPPPATPATRPSSAVLERGRALVMQGDASLRLPACVQCHGSGLTGAQPNVPGLVGLPADYLMAQLGGWRTGQRHAHAPDCMATIMQRLSNSDAYAAVSWLSSQPVPADAHPEPSLPAPAEGALELKCGSAPLPQASAGRAGATR